MRRRGMTLCVVIRRKGPMGPVGAKTGYDFVRCDMKKGAGGSRYVQKWDMTLYVMIQRKGLTGADGCEDGL